MAIQAVTLELDWVAATCTYTPVDLTAPDTDVMEFTVHVVNAEIDLFNNGLTLIVPCYYPGTGPFNLIYLEVLTPSADYTEMGSDPAFSGSTSGVLADFTSIVSIILADLLVYSGLTASDYVVDGTVSAYIYTVGTPFSIAYTAASNPPPVLVAPTNGATGYVGDAVALSATATGAVRVAFMVNGVIVAADLSDPYSGSWTPETAAAFTLKARAFDVDENYLDSVVATFTATNRPPTVTNQTPVGGWVGVVGRPLRLGAIASLSLGVASVQFFIGATSVGTVTKYPFALPWSPVTAGTFAVTALATGVNAATATSTGNSLVIAASPVTDLDVGGWGRQTSYNPSLATGVGTASAHRPNTRVAAVATSTATAYGPSVRVSPRPAVITTTAVANAPTRQVLASAGVATATGTAQAPVPRVAVTGQATSTTTAHDPTVIIT